MFNTGVSCSCVRHLSASAEPGRSCVWHQLQLSQAAPVCGVYQLRLAYTSIHTSSISSHLQGRCLHATRKTHHFYRTSPHVNLDILPPSAHIHTYLLRFFASKRKFSNITFIWCIQFPSFLAYKPCISILTSLICSMA